MKAVAFESGGSKLQFELFESDKSVMVSIKTRTGAILQYAISKSETNNLFSFFTTNASEFLQSDEIDRIIEYLVQEKAKLKD